MSEAMHLSMRTRMQAARLAHLYRKYDHQRTDLKDEGAILVLLRQASADDRLDIVARYQELLAGLEPGERTWLRNHGLGDAGSSAAADTDDAAENQTRKPLMVYRGQVIRN
ncbi:hypothetical protein M0534_04505 [Methylonatrum kenyense]|uniref:hypothetical protein n=1 Tax=Methylonatrum kenyense TaxID=455253 RepID=UPI0020C01E35|nr:hypothetical protein [Methylonatrum kenyense]MCK8515589.1 hypothetical protein [Methylonatrum kenyense]